MESEQPSAGDKLRILCLHGFRTSGKILQASLWKSGFEKDVEEYADLVFVDAPYQCQPDELESIPEWLKASFPTFHEWWYVTPDWVFQRWEASVEYLRKFICENGPFDGVLGFSQGGCMASVLYMLQAEKAYGMEQTDPFDFLILMSARINRSKELVHLYSGPKREVPVLGFIGLADTAVLPSETEELLGCFADPTVVRSPAAGHTVFPLDEAQKVAVKEFLRARLVIARQQKR
mmetsp:Transcript_16878/g.36717  ORF Transcript_16878/g.36717 Transcript_16878/m.36717 type:complete len:234 (-) Transcript_16878:1442-2143(-)